MTPVYQTILNNTNGNCWAAVWASLLNLPLEQVPNFVEQEDDHKALCDFIRPLGYEYDSYIVNGWRTDLPEGVKSQYLYFGEQLPEAISIDGYYDATVWSPGYFDRERFLNDPEYKPTCHAVIVDKHFNIVHDPNPNYKGVEYPMADIIGCNGVIGVSLYRKINIQNN